MWFESAQVELVRDTFPEWMALVFALLSHLGSVWFVAPAVALAFWFGDRHRFTAWLGIVMGGYAVMLGLKGIFSTPRPGVEPAIAPEALPTVVELAYAPAVDVSTTSFPSGHAVAATVIWTMIALEFDWGTRRQRLLGGATMIGLVSFARVGVTVHYPIDVIVGVLAGAIYLSVILTVRRRLQQHDPHQATSAVFVIAAAISLVAFLTSGRPDTMALFGGCLGALLAWQYATPSRQPWPLSVRGFGRGLVGLAIVTGAATVLLVVESTLVWLCVGLTAGLTVVGLPALLAATTASLDRVGVTS